MKIFYQLLSCLTVLTGLTATQCHANYCYGQHWDAELRAAYFYPSNHIQRQIYQGAWWDIEAEVSTPISNCLDLWANVSYFYKEGRSLGLRESTNIQLAPVSVGVKYIYPVSCSLNVYAGLGANFSVAHINNDSHDGHKHTNHCQLGATFKSGAYWNFTERFFADFFVDYLFIPLDFKNSFDVGGVRVGLGIGMRI